MRVFVSYAGENEATALGVVEGLKANGAEVFYAPVAIRAGDSIVGKIEAGLEAADVYLLLWSAQARVSAWVTKERNAAFAASTSGTQLRFVTLRIDPTPLPRLLACYLHIEYDDAAWSQKVLESSGVPPEEPPRYQDVIIERPRLMQDILRRLSHGDCVTVLGADGTGATTLAGQLADRMKVEGRGRVVKLSARPLGAESIADYMERMQAALQAPAGRDPIVAIVDGWTTAPTARLHLHAFASTLRALKEAEKLNYVAMGSFALFELTSHNEAGLSPLNNTEFVGPLDFDESEVMAWLDAAAPGRWDGAAAGELWRHTHGHPRLMKLVMENIGRGGWAEAARHLRRDKWLEVRLCQALGHEECKEEFLRAAKSERGLPRNPSKRAQMKLLHSGLFAMNTDSRVVLRFPALETWGEELLEDA